MNIYDQLIANWEAGYYTVVQSEGSFIIFSTKDRDGNLRNSSWYSSIEEAKNSIGYWSGPTQDNILEVAKLNNWKIIDTIHPTELMGAGLEPGQKVRIKKNAKEECEKFDVDWNNNKEKMVNKICEVKNRDGNDYAIYIFDKSDYWTYPPSALSPVYEDDEKSTWLEEGKKNGWVKDGDIVV